jgi:hypothetical protein
LKKWLKQKLESQGTIKLEKKWLMGWLVHDLFPFLRAIGKSRPEEEEARGERGGISVIGVPESL